MLVFESSTLILAAKIELLPPFLNDIGMEIAIPNAVEQECCGGAKTLDVLIIRKALDDGRIQVRKVRSGKLIAKLISDFNMGRGEAGAIALAIEEKKARIVGIDDKIGIDACKLLGLPFTTAIGLLVRSRQKSLIDLDDARTRLSALARYGRYRKSFIDDALRRLEQTP
jgi:predicted nucleic acid-binding protein